MREVTKPAESGKWERIRRLRYGHVLKLIRFRYGANGVPDDEAGRPDLMELIWLASSAPAGADMKVLHCIELYAPWMDDEEKRDLMELVAMTPTYEKAKTSQELGNKLMLTNAERERLRLYSIRPYDLTPEEFEKQSKARKKASRAELRRQSGVRTWGEYLAERHNKPKPWLAEGISQRQWQRKQKTCRVAVSHMSRDEGPTIFNKEVTSRATSEQGEEPVEGRQGNEVTAAQREIAKTEQAERTKGVSHADGPRRATPADELRRVREARAAWARRRQRRMTDAQRQRTRRNQDERHGAQISEETA
jgi:hypothetical protein